MLFLVSMLLTAPVQAHEGHPQMVLQSWDKTLIAPQAGTRFAAIVEAVDEDPIHLEVLDGDTWKTTKEIFRIRNRALLQTDLSSPASQVDIRSKDQARITYMEWDLVVPVYEEKGPPRPPTPGVLPQELVDFGVVSRSDWGAQPTLCTATEDNWYRMAIHHTAGHQDTNGSIEEQVRWLQAYFIGTGEYCDIAYQFLVGSDGSIWEGRPYDYYSGATGGDQNDGNMAISFMGCYDSTACEVGPHQPTRTMLKKVHEFIYTVSQLEEITTDSDHIKGHDDWPGNNTACPGDYIEAQIPNWFVPPGPDWAATLTDSSFALSEEAPIVLKTGETLEGYFEFENTGRSTWTSNTTLAPLPMDEVSPVQADDWINGARVTTAEQNPATGGTSRFSFSIKGNAPGVYYQEFSLLEENTMWFNEDGGTDPAEIILRIVVDDEVVPADSGDSAAVDTSDFGREEIEDIGACACASSTPRSQGWIALIGLTGLVLTRRKQKS